MSTPDTRSCCRPALLIAVLALVFSAVALFVALRPSPLSTGGTWVCQDATGGHIAVNNPANCGPDDLVLWCTKWVIDNPSTNAGHCAD